MGFFTDLKEDLSQAVDELLPDDGMETEESIKEDVGETEDGAESIELEKLLDKVDSIELPQEDEMEEAAEETQENEILEDIMPVLMDEKENIEDRGVETKMDMDATTGKSALDETAVITVGMTINGDISSEGSMDLIGTINGNVDILGKLNITGTITGNSNAAEIFADNAKITGEVVSSGSVKIGQSSVIIGNINAMSAVIAGAVKGDIDVKGPVILDASAIVMGNIKSKSVQINNGAVIEGMCSQCYAEVNPTNFFEDIKNGKNK